MKKLIILALLALGCIIGINACRSPSIAPVKQIETPVMPPVIDEECPDGT